MQIYETKPVGPSRLVPNLLCAILSLCIIQFAYLGLFVASPLRALTAIVADHSQKIDEITKMISTQFKPSVADEINRLYKEKLNEVTTRESH